MKTKLYVLIAVFFMTLGVNAQIDRSQQPKPGPAPEISLEEPQEFELKNGLKIMVVENHKLPRVSFRLAFDRDPVVEGSKAGVTSLLGAMLGNGTTNILTKSVKIGQESNWEQITAGSMHTLALKKDGTLWAWGNNGNGTLGQNDGTYRSSPIQLPGTQWKKMIKCTTSTVWLVK